MFTHCANCKEKLVRIDKASNKLIPTASDCPECMNCIQTKTATDELLEWAKTKFHGKNSNWNNTGAGSKTESKTA